MVRSLISFMLFFLTFGFINGQNSISHEVSVKMPEVALLRLESTGSPNIDFELKAPLEAGHPLDISELRISKYWLNYSSVHPANLPDRKVYATLSGNLPPGTVLFVEASPYSGKGQGKKGSSSGRKILSGQPVEIINGIGTCFTGKGINQGHLLTYSLELDNSNYTAIGAGNYNHIQVIYTIAE